jgi:hypothetical protein
MPERTDKRKEVEESLKAFVIGTLPEAARCLFGTLGYSSDRRLPISTPQQFCQQLDPGSKLTDREREALNCHWALQNQPLMGASKPATPLG